MKFTLEVKSPKIQNRHYVLVVTNNQMMVVDEENFGVNINETDLYNILDEFFKKRAT